MAFDLYDRNKKINPPACPLGKGRKDDGGHVFDIKKGPFELEKPPKGPGSQCTGSLTEFVPLYQNQEAYFVCKCGISEPYFHSHTQ